MPAMYPFVLPALLAMNATKMGVPTVALNYGVFQGSTDGNLATFLGIPYSQPVARFELPTAPKTLPGVRNATAFGPACPQQAMSIPRVPSRPESYTDISEDCLTLNVFKPALAGPQSKLPVFVWIHGGGFEVGRASDTRVRPLVARSMDNERPLIVVTPNYRISAFGFLGGKEVGDAGVTNLGLRDQIFALEWVQEHISAFGGDPERVVIGGVSAGAISAALLLLDNKRFEQSALFRGAFMESGAPVSLGSVADGQPHYDGLVAANNCTGSTDTLECLRGIPFDNFMATVNHTANLFSYSSLNNVWRPRVDGDVVVRNPLVSVARGLYAKVPIMTGNCDDEGTMFSLTTTNITTNDEFERYIHSNYLPKATAEEIANLSALYPDDPAQGSPFDTGIANTLTPQFKRLAAFQGDYVFLGARRFFLEHASATQPAWSWLNKRGKWTPVFGAMHGCDFPVWFPTDNHAKDTFGFDALVNFINTLDPNGALGSGSSKNISTAIFWPTWNTSGVHSESTSLLTFSDPGRIEVEAEDFRIEAIRFLSGLLLDEAGKSG
ncbi:Alpha/Beta hydrolase protein [Mycena galericulata]|nr:Alpha/Beta hydrolase protein [Mycena galericulata]